MCIRCVEDLNQECEDKQARIDDFDRIVREALVVTGEGTTIAVCAKERGGCGGYLAKLPAPPFWCCPVCTFAKLQDAHGAIDRMERELHERGLAEAALADAVRAGRCRWSVSCREERMPDGSPAKDADEWCAHCKEEARLAALS